MSVFATNNTPIRDRLVLAEASLQRLNTRVVNYYDYDLLDPTYNHALAVNSASGGAIALSGDSLQLTQGSTLTSVANVFVRPRIGEKSYSKFRVRLGPTTAQSFIGFLNYTTGRFESDATRIGFQTAGFDPTHWWVVFGTTMYSLESLGFPAVPGDDLAVEFDGSKVNYYVNEQLAYTQSTRLPTASYFPLVAVAGHGEMTSTYTLKVTALKWEFAPTW